MEIPIVLQVSVTPTAPFLLIPSVREPSFTAVRSPNLPYATHTDCTSVGTKHHSIYSSHRGPHTPLLAWQMVGRQSLGVLDGEGETLQRKSSWLPP